jgi:hypothetical protein
MSVASLTEVEFCMCCPCKEHSLYDISLLPNWLAHGNTDDSRSRDILFEFRRKGKGQAITTKVTYKSIIPLPRTLSIHSSQLFYDMQRHFRNKIIKC